MADVLQKIDQVAQMAGIRGERRGKLLYYAFDLGKGRNQTVMVTDFAESDSGMHVICFVSPCQQINKGFLSSGMSKGQAVTLLRLNAQMAFGHFCLLKMDDGEYLCVRQTQILETMEIEEFKAACLSVADMADSWEQKIGQDVY